jgi:hypothetical protein
MAANKYTISTLGKIGERIVEKIGDHPLEQDSRGQKGRRADEPWYVYCQCGMESGLPFCSSLRAFFPCAGLCSPLHQ